METATESRTEGALADLVRDLPVDQEQLVSRVFRQRQLKAGSVVVEEGDYPDFVYIVKEGSARVFKRTQREPESTLFIAGPGDTFGFESLFSESSERAVIAMEDLVVAYSPRDTVLHLMETVPQFSINVARLLTGCVKKMEDRAVSLSSGTLQQRLVLALLKLAEGGEQSEEGVKLVGVTHEFLSTVVGASREAVTIALLKIKKTGAIPQQGKGTLIVNPDILRSLVQRALI